MLCAHLHCWRPATLHSLCEWHLVDTLAAGHRAATQNRPTR